MTVDNNPLKQYFRRPAVHIKLPSGGQGYPQGAIDIPPTGEIPVYPMTAIDEITARTPDALFNGSAVTELIRSCLPNIKDPWMVNSNDLDAILIAIKAASGNDNLEIESTCPSCNETATYGINLVGVLSTLKAGDYSKILEIGELQIQFRPITFKEMNQAAIQQFEVQSFFESLDKITDEQERGTKTKEALKTITDITMELLSGGIAFIQTPTVRVDEKEYILDFLKNCDRNIYFKIRDYNAELKMSTQIKPMPTKCIHCQHEYEQPFTLNPSDFFG